MRLKKPPNPLKHVKEADVKNAILTWLSWQKNCMAWPNDSVGIFDPTKKIYRRPMNRYKINGVSDILGIWHGKPLAIEVKRPVGGKVSEEQKAFIERFCANGGVAFVATSLQEVVDRLTKVV